MQRLALWWYCPYACMPRRGIQIRLPTWPSWPRSMTSGLITLTLSSKTYRDPQLVHNDILYMQQVCAPMSYLSRASATCT